MKSRYKIIEFDEKHFLAYLDYHQLVPVNKLIYEVFKLIESHTEEQIVFALSEQYPENDIYNSIRQIRAILANNIEKPSCETELKIFAPTPSISRRRMKSPFLGASVAQKELLKALSKYAQVHVTQEYDGIDNLVVVPFDPKSKSSMSFIINENYNGVFLAFLDDTDMISLLTYLHVPVVLPAYVIRGANGRITNSMLRWYSYMRDFDTFMVPNHETADFFSTFTHDTSVFNVIPFGVDADFFHPIDKEKAKQEIADLLNMPEINSKKIVGYISRFEVEKGAGILVDIARLMPDILFLAVGMTEEPRNYDFPSNLITVTPQRREKTRIFYNAFDVFCFPSIASTETFGLIVLEAMACGTVPVVSSYDGPKYLVKDTGIIIDATTFDHDMASLGGTAFAYSFAEAISELLHDNQKREQMGEKA
ncbi:glycosyltransferase, partial [Candidatus Poribacteria bacterium]|nr:glycosyltransferase [Candidatus Poribacteria bacterium]